MIAKEYEKLDAMTEISEAVRLHYFNEDKFNTNFISIVWTIPASREKATKLSLLAECLRLGKNGDRAALEENLAEMYGAVFEATVLQKGGRQLLALNMECVTDNAAQEKVYKHASTLLKEIVETKINEDALKQAKNRLKTMLMEKNDSAAQYAVEKLIDIVYPEDGFSVHCDGYIEDIDGISVKELNDLYIELKKSAHTDIFISGDIEDEKALETAKSFISRRDDVDKLPVDEVKEAGGCAEKTENRGIGQSRIAMAYTTRLNAWGKDWCTGLVLREILCGAGASVLYDSVRQEEGLCYYIGGRLMRFRMVYVIDAGVAPGSEDKTVKLIEKGIEGCCIDEKQLDSAKKAVLRDLKAMKDRRTGEINECMNEMLLGVTVEHHAEDDIEAITISDIRNAIKGLNKKGVFIVAADK